MTEKFNYTTFYIRDRQIVDGSNCFFGLMTALSSQKLKDTKYSMWLQKEVNNSTQQDFLNRVPIYSATHFCVVVEYPDSTREYF